MHTAAGLPPQDNSYPIVANAQNTWKTEEGGQHQTTRADESSTGKMHSTEPYCTGHV